jgi:hypothetical protein
VRVRKEGKCPGLMLTSINFKQCEHPKILAHFVFGRKAIVKIVGIILVAERKRLTIIN